MNTAVKWYAIKVKWRSEKLVLSQLAIKGITAYTPMRSKVSCYVRKTVTRQLPLLPTYIFVQINHADYVKVLETEYVFNFVRIGGNMMPVSEQEIDILRRIEGLDASYAVSETDFNVGQNVMVGLGPLYGMGGIVTAIKSKGKVVVNINSLGMALQIEINKNALQATRAV